jgi:hypothetical protein
MRPWLSAWVGWGLLGLGLVGNAVGVVLSVANGRWLQNPGEGLVLTLAFGSFLVVGCLLVVRRPDNRIGWIFTAVGLLTTAAILAEGYVVYAYVTHPGPLPGRLVAAWVYTWIWNPVIMLTVVFPLLLFPTGRSLSPRWRPGDLAGRCRDRGMDRAGGAQPVAGCLQRHHPQPDRCYRRRSQRWTGQHHRERLNHPRAGRGNRLAGHTLLALSRGGTPAAEVVRLCRHAGRVGSLSTWVVPNLGNLPWVMVCALPVAVGIAVLRYRLYDIDLLINRTLVYGSLTAILGLGYVGVVLVLGQVFGGVGGNPPSWVVAGATLAAAALFRPARRRIQALVDRRFNRRKYDAAGTVEVFTARLRDEIDLAALSEELLAVVDQTMEPTQVSLWLRPSTERMQRTGT